MGTGNNQGSNRDGNSLLRHGDGMSEVHMPGLGVNHDLGIRPMSQNPVYG